MSDKYVKINVVMTDDGTEKYVFDYNGLNHMEILGALSYYKDAFTVTMMDRGVFYKEIQELKTKNNER